MWIALRRLGIHDTFVEVLKDCYAKTSFFVEDEYGTSTAKDTVRRNKTKVAHYRRTYSYYLCPSWIEMWF